MFVFLYTIVVIFFPFCLRISRCDMLQPWYFQDPSAKLLFTVKKSSRINQSVYQFSKVSDLSYSRKKISFLLLIMIQPIKQFRHFLDYHGPDSVVWFLFSFFLFLLCWFRWFSYDNVRNLIFLSIQATSTVFLRFVCCRSEIIYLDEIVLGCKDSISFGFSRDFCVTLFLIARLR